MLAWIRSHPRWSAWAVLAIGMNAVVVWQAQDVGLQTGQWAALLVATTLVAGLCVWIIGWEDKPDTQNG